MSDQTTADRGLKKMLVVQALQKSEFSGIQLFGSSQIYGQAFSSGDGKDTKIIFSGVVTSSSLNAKKCSTPSCSCPDRTGITRVGREAKGSLWKVSFASPAQRNKLNELKPRSHDREPWFLCLYLFAQLFVVLAGTAWAAELQPVTLRLFFPLSPPTDSWELNWNIFLFCCQPGRGCFSCSWNQHHGQKFPSFLSGDSAGVFPWQQVWSDTAFLCPATSLFHHFIFLQLHRERSGLINIHIWRKKPSSLQAANCSGELWPSAASSGWFNPLNEAWHGKADRTLITGSWYHNYQ